MALTDSLPTEDASGLSITDWRLINAGIIARDAAGNPRLGVFPTHNNPIVTGTASMAYSVGPFVAATSRNGTGVEFVANDAATSVSTTAAPGSNSRIDVIWVRCRFPSYTDTGQTTPLFGVTQGSPGASPTKPSIPAGALELATATVPSTATATNSGVVITQTFRYTAAAGGAVRVRNQVELDAWTPADGADAYRIDTGELMSRFGGAWVQVWTPTSAAGGIFRVVPGSVTGSGVTIGASGQVILSSVPASSTIQIRGIFSSAYRHYRIYTKVTSKVTTGYILQGIVGTTAIAGTSYSWTRGGVTNGGQIPAAQATGQANFADPIFGDAGSQGSSVMDVFAPNAAESTQMISQLAYLGGATGTVHFVANLNSSDQLTGLQITTPAGGTTSAEIRIFGIV